MASISVAANEVGIGPEATLVANTVDTITFTGVRNRVRLVNVDGAAAIWFRSDGVAPTVGGKASHYLPALAKAQAEIAIRRLVNEDTVLKLISSGTPTYHAEAAAP